MKNLITKLSIALILVSSFSSCAYRLVDFTVISTKNAELGIDRKDAKKAFGKKSYSFSPINLKDAIDNALENAGKEYDLLIDGVVTLTSYPFVTVIKVNGLAVSSASIKADLGEDGYQEWLEKQDVLNAETAEVIEE